MNVSTEGSTPRPLAALAKLSVLTDQPLRDSEIAAGQDVFDHAAFADTLLKLLTENTPPLSIGLFGSWGIGKSTVVNILFKSIRESQANRLFPIYFNAWKYSGDSFRRQFLIEVAEQILGKDHDDVERIRQLNYSDVLKRDVLQENLVTAISEGIQRAFSSRMAFNAGALARITLGAVTLLCIGVIALLVAPHSVPLAIFIASVLAPAVFIWIAGVKFEELVRIQETSIVDPKLIFPEQFEKEFRDLLSSRPLGGRYPVVAIDDIDRCDPVVIKDILISTKTFIGQERCFFIVPCDDKTVVEVFRDPNQRVGYADESLRKYFNVSIRIPPITSTDLIDFANNVVRQTGLPDEIVQVAILANCRDARKMKHFLNSLAMKYNVAKVREASGRMTCSVDDNILELCKAVVIEDAYPDLYSKVVENPRIIEVIERAAVEGDAAELKELGLEKWQELYPGLSDILQQTRDIRMSHADIFFTLKASNPETRIPYGSELKTSIISGDTARVERITTEITSNEGREAAADLLLDAIRKARNRFLRNALTSGLCLYSADVFLARDMKKVATKLIGTLLEGYSAVILEFDIGKVMYCAEGDGAHYAQVMDSVLNALANPDNPMPVNIEEITRVLYSRSDYRKRLAKTLNQRWGEWPGDVSSEEDEHQETATGWAAQREGLQALSSLQLTAEVDEDERVPSLAVVIALIKAIGSNIADDNLRRDIIFAHWRDEFATAMGTALTVRLAKTTESFSEFKPDDELSNIAFVITSLNLQPAIFSGESVDALWAYLRNGYKQVEDPSAKLAVLHVISLAAVCAADPPVLAEATDLTLSEWQLLILPALRAEIDFILGLDARPLGVQLATAAISKQLSAIQKELNTPTEKTEQRLDLCFTYARYLEADKLEGVLVSGLDVEEEKALTFWVEVAKQRDGSLRPEYRGRFALRCLELTADGTSAAELSQMRMAAFCFQLEKVSDDVQSTLIDPYFRLLKDKNTNARSAAVHVLDDVQQALRQKQDFKLGIAGVVTYLRHDVSPTNLLEYRLTLDAILRHASFFEYQWRDVAELARRSLAQDDIAVQQYGLEIVSKMSKIDNQDQSDLVHLVTKFARTSEESSVRAGEVLRAIQDRISEDSALAELRRFLDGRQE